MYPDEREAALTGLRLGDLPNDEQLIPKFQAAGRSELQRLIAQRKQALSRLAADEIPVKPYQPSVTEEIIKPLGRAALSLVPGVAGVAAKAMLPSEAKPVSPPVSTPLPSPKQNVPRGTPEVPERVGRTEEGRIVYQRPGGEQFSEISRTVTRPEINEGRPTNIPSVFGGKEVDEDEAVKRVIAAGGTDPETGRPLPAFNTIDEAVAAAKARSAGIRPTRSISARPEPAATLSEFLVPPSTRERLKRVPAEGYQPMFPPPPPSATEGFMPSVQKGLKGGAYSLGASAAGTIERLQAPDEALKPIMSKIGDELAQEAAKYGPTATPQDRGIMQGIIDVVTDPDRLGNLLGNAAVQTAPSLGAFFAGTALSGNPAVGTAAMAATIYFQQAGDTYRESYQAYKAKGLSDVDAHEKAYYASGLAGLVSSAVNALAIPASMMEPFKSKLANLLIQYVANVSVDTADQITQNMVAKGSFDPNRSLAEGVPEAVVGSALLTGPETIAAVRSVATGPAVIRHPKPGQPGQAVSPAPPPPSAPLAAPPAEEAQPAPAVPGLVSEPIPASPAEEAAPVPRRSEVEIAEIARQIDEARPTPSEARAPFLVPKGARAASPVSPEAAVTPETPLPPPPLAPQPTSLLREGERAATAIEGQAGASVPKPEQMAKQVRDLEDRIKQLDHVLNRTPDQTGLRPGTARRAKVERQLTDAMGQYAALTGKATVPGSQGPLEIPRAVVELAQQRGPTTPPQIVTPPAPAEVPAASPAPAPPAPVASTPPVLGPVTPAAPAGGPVPFDQKRYRRHKANLTRAIKSGEPTKIIEAADAALADFEQTGYPDDWSRWEQAKEDAEYRLRTGQQSKPDRTQTVKNADYDQLVQMSYDAQKSRRTLNDLPPRLYHDVTGFAASGLPATPEAVTSWLESQGIFGAVSPHVQEILKHQRAAKEEELGRLAEAELERRRGGQPTPTAPSPVPAAATPEPQPNEEITSPELKKAEATHAIASFVENSLKEKTAKGVLAFSLEELTKRANEDFGGTQAAGTYTPKDLNDALELGVNRYLLSGVFRESLPAHYMDTPTAAREALTIIREQIMDRIPAQAARRTAEQQEFQQFSTPPDLAFVMNYATKEGRDDVMLEPSAGLGSLAVWARNQGAVVEVNELSPRRRELLQTLFPNLWQENAEQIANILPNDPRFKAPSVVVMNPPFSATAGRIEGERKSINAFKHIEQAMDLLRPNGRLVALIGESFMGQSELSKREIAKLAKQYQLRASIDVSGEGYKKYGTDFDNRILVYDKTAPTEAAPETRYAANPSDALTFLEEVRDARLPIEPLVPEITTPRRPERPAPQPRGKTVAARGERAGGERQPPPAPTHAVGPRAGEGVRERPAGPGLPEYVPRSPVSKPQPAARAGVGAGKPVRSGTAAAGRGRAEAEPVAETGRPVSAEPTGRAAEAGKPAEGSVPSGVPVQSGMTVEAKPAAEAVLSEKPITDSLFERYKPARLKVPGAKPHPGNLVQSAAMADTLPPEPTYTPNLPAELIQSGGLSLAQLETPVYAGQAHAEILPDGNRKGFFNGDGTGVGKGRQISAVILDNFRQGRERAVWISESARLIADAKRDWQDIGGDPAQVFELSKYKVADAIDRPKGVLFLTYSTLGSGLMTDKAGTLQAKVDKKTQQQKQSRVNQILSWLGKDFEGVVVFDEAHNMQNSSVQKGKRGQQEAAVRALAGIELEKNLPKARVLYSSATGATKVESLSYLRRLGLWGEGTAFPDALKFIGSMQKGGLAAMEVVARDMKALGTYISRSLDFSDVTYGRMKHELDEGQRQVYDTMARFWQIVLQDNEAAMEQTGLVDADTGKTKNAQAKSAFLSSFWGSQQRFFNQVLTSMQMPSVIAGIRKDLADGKSVVVQLVNTNEAGLTRELAKRAMEEGDLEDLDLTPRQQLMQYLDNSFPTQMFEEYQDEEGNVLTRPVVDSQGKPVHSAEAMKRKEELKMELGSVKVPDGPLEYLLNTFGPDMIAEVTGRTKRAVRIMDALGREKVVVQPRSPSIAAKEADDFLGDTRQILVFSDAGGTGRSFHSDRRFKNQRQRVHYLVQPGWRADKAVQGFGRTHRTNEANAPHYVLVMTNLKGHKRFVSTIARRLDQLGALTKGERKAGSSGIITASDNLENEYAQAALKDFYKAVVRGEIEGVTYEGTISQKMGITHLIDEETGQFNESNVSDIPQFLNRILALEVEDQNRVFRAFEERMHQAVEMAAANGTLDVGLETYKAKSVKVLNDQTVYRHPASGATTAMVSMDTEHEVNLLPPKEVEKDPRFRGYMESNQTKKVYGVLSTGTRTNDKGEIHHYFKLQSPVESKYYYVSEEQKDQHYHLLPNEQGRARFEEVVAKHPGIRKEKVHLLSGTLLPIWDRLPDDHVRVMRVQADTGKRYLGRFIREQDLQAVLRKLGATTELPTVTGEEAMKAMIQKRAEIVLVNGWKFGRRTIAGETRIELMGRDVADSWKLLEKAGVFRELIQSKTRFFIPSGESGAGIFEAVVKQHAVAEVVYPETGTGEGPAHMKVHTKEGGQRAAAGLSPEQLRQMGEGLYTDPPSKVIVKEVTQNAIDATRGLTNPASSQVKVDVFPDQRKIVVEDTGTGILPETAFKELVDFGGSKKTANAAGLFGVAKVVIFAGAKDIDIVSRAHDPERGIVETHLTGSGEDWLTQEKGLEVDIKTADPDAPTGTKMTLVYPENMKFDAAKIRQWLEALAAFHQMPGQITAAIDKYPVDPQTRLQGQKLSKVSTLDFSGGTIDFLISEKKSEQTSGRIEILNQGIPQFASSFSFGKDHKLELPVLIVANVRSRREAGQKNYPFSTNREKLRGDVKEMIRKYIMEHLVKDAMAEEREKYKKAMEEGPVVEGTDQQVIDTSGTQPAEFVKALAERPYQKPFIEMAAEAFKSIQQAMLPYGQQYGEVVFQGIGLGQHYLGLNVKGNSVFQGDPNNYILLNPYIILRQAQALAVKMNDETEVLHHFANHVASTVVHELTHQEVMGHNEKFTSALSSNHALINQEMSAAGNAIYAMLTKGGVREAKDFISQIGSDLAQLEKNWNAERDDIFDKISSGYGGARGRASSSEHPERGSSRGLAAKEVVRAHAGYPAEGMAEGAGVRRGGTLLAGERGSVQVGLRPAARLTGTTTADGKFHAASPDIEARVQAAKKGIQPASWREWLTGHLQTVWEQISREFPHLPDKAEFSELRTGLLSLQKQKGVQADRIERALADIVDPLTAPEYDLLEWKALLADLAREGRAGHALPFGYDVDRVNHDLEQVNDLLAENPPVQRAWEKRQALWKTMKTEYQDAMDRIGFDVAKRISKQDYFRHQVLNYAREQRLVGGTGARLRTPTGRGFLKQRHGSTYDINANYLQAEFEVMAQMAYDTQLAKTIATVDRVHNIQPRLQSEAKAVNARALEKMIDAEKTVPGGLSLIEQQLKHFKQRLGMFHKKLRDALELPADAPLSFQNIQEIADDPNSPGQPSALGIFKALNERRAFVRKTLGKAYQTWEDLVPDGHALWQPRQGNIFYMADTIPAQMAKALQEHALEQLGLHKEDLRKMLAMGGPREQYVVPQEVADTLNDLQQNPRNWFVDFNRDLLSHWKQLVLIAPRRVIRYNLRNLTGDADATFVGNRHAFQHLPRVMKEMWPVFFENQPLTGEAKEWAERGGHGSTLQVQEMGDLNDLKVFRASIEKAARGGWETAPLALWNKYWQTARLSTDFRESWLRYANYLEYLDQMQRNDGRPENFGASRRETVMALPDIRDRAFKLSNELTGAYDRISAAGQTLRRFWYPFWSWQEVNVSRYARLMRNALIDEDALQAGKIGAVAGKRAAVSGAAFMMKAMGFWVAMQVFNTMFFDDEERELRETDPYVANRPHLILGPKTDDGKIPFFSGLGALGDALSWVGLDVAPGLAGDYLHGRMTLGEIWQQMWHAPINKVWQGLTPLVKGTVDLIGRIQTYPDVFHPRPMQNRGEYVAQQFTVGPEYRRLKNLPSKGLGEEVAGLVVQSVNPEQAAYSRWHEIERKYLERMGKEPEGIYWRGAQGTALTNLALAIKQGDPQLEQQYRNEFERLMREKHGPRFYPGIVAREMAHNLYAKAPLAGVSIKEREAIVAQMDPEERRVLHRAEQYYEHTILAILPEGERKALIGRLRGRGWLTKPAAAGRQIPAPQPAGGLVPF
jgi:tRNA1(Val) A37 N6-methylase TrmN6